MIRTNYTNPHGLVDVYNKSTASDIGILVSNAIN